MLTPKASVRRGSTRAFTLIELLVVVAIIAVLAAMLLPSLSQARERAKAVVDMGNKRQVAMILDMYADENSEVMALKGNPDFGGSVTNYYWRWFYYDQDYLTDLKITACPKYEYSKVDEADLFRAKGYDGMYSPAVQNVYREVEADVKVKWGVTAGKFFRGLRRSQIYRPEDFMMVACQSSAIDDIYGCGGNSFRHAGRTSYGGGAATSLWLAHNNRTAASFSDGHAELADLERVTNQVTNGLRRDGTSTGIQYILNSNEVETIYP